MEVPDATEFIDRLTLLARGRQLYPWLAGVGWSKTDVARVKNGHIPGSEKLAMLARSEPVSLTWLLTGQGAPYVTGAAGVAEIPAPRIRTGPRAELVERIDELPDAAVKSLLAVAKLIR